MTYPLPPVPICGRCGHSQAVHLYGKRLGRKVRTSCTHGDSTYVDGMCECREYQPSGSEGGEAA